MTTSRAWRRRIKRERVGKPTSEWTVLQPADDAALLAAHETQTFQEIADAVGLSRERVRQRVRRAGGTGNAAGRSRLSDVLGCIHVIRSTRSVNSWAAAALACDRPVSQIQKAVDALGMHAQIARLFRARRRHGHRQHWTRGSATAALAALAVRLGRTPGIPDINSRRYDVPWHTTYFRLFGSMQAAQVAAGLLPNGVGGAGHVRD